MCNGCLRVIGDLYRYPKYHVEDWSNWKDAKARLKKYVEKCIAHNELSKTQTFEALCTAICNYANHSYLKINPLHLWIKVSSPDTPVWQCTSCGDLIYIVQVVFAQIVFQSYLANLIELVQICTLKIITLQKQSISVSQ